MREGGDGPPRRLRGLLLRVLPDDEWAGELVTELDEEHARVEERRGRARAAVWYARQLVSPATLRFAWLIRRRARSVARNGEGTMGTRPGGWDGWLQDVRHAVRSMLREPRFALFAVLTLALGIGANAAMYGVADRLFLSGPDHVAAPGEVARVYLDFPPAGGEGGRTTPWIPYATADAIVEGTTAFARAALYRLDESLVVQGDDARPVTVTTAGPGYFDVLGVTPAAGRFFGGGGRVERDVAVIAAHLGGAEAIGSTIELPWGRFTVVGVAPAGFTGPHLGTVDVWVPVAPEEAGNRNWMLVGRLPPDRAGEAGRALAAADADALHRRTDPGRSFQWALEGTVVARPLSSDDAGETSAEAEVARLLTAVMGLVLLIACANVINLMLARLTRRRQEVAVRLALGAGRWRLVRLLLTESLVVAAVGALCSLPMAWAAGISLRRTLLPEVAWTSSPLDGRVLAVTALVALVSGLLVGLLPARLANRTDLVRGLRSGARDGGGRARLHGVLATGQIALAAILLACAGLFLKSFWTLRVTDLGVDAGSATMLTLHSLDAEAIDDGSEAEAELYRRALQVALGEPGVEAAALTVGLPLYSLFGASVQVPGMDSIPRLPGGGPYVSAVGGGYFDAVGTRILRGRPITGEDVETGAGVTVVSETMARTLWPDQEAVGRCLFTIGAGQSGRIGESPCSVVVGVAEDVHRVGYREPPSLQHYIPLGQNDGFSGTVLVVRPGRDAAAALQRIRAAIRAMDPAVDHVETVTLRQILEPQIRPWRLGATVLVLTAVLAVAVSVVGVYGVLSYLVAQRNREIGVRIALGASRKAVRGLFLGIGARAAVAGVGVGVALVLAGGRWLEPLLFETSVADPLVLGGVVGGLTTAALLACLVPARQATRVSPLEAMRTE